MRQLVAIVAATIAVASGCTCTQLAPLAYPCDPALGPEVEQCSEGWRCGLERRCHAKDVPADYVCESDSDCEGGWRCGPDRRCVDPSLDALRPNADAGRLAPERVNPRVLTELPEAVGATRELSLPGRCDGGAWLGMSASVVADGGLTRFVAYADGREASADGGVPSGPECAAPPRRVGMDVVQWPAPSRTLAVAEVGRDTFLLVPDGGLCRYTFVPGQPPASNCNPSALGFPATQLRITGETKPRLIAFSAQQYVLVDPADGGRTPPRSIIAPDGTTTERINDIEGPAAFAIPSSRTQLLHAATARGLYVSSLMGVRFLDGGTAPPDTWEPAIVGGLGCLGPAPGFEWSEPQRLHYWHSSLPGDSYLALHLRVVDAGIYESVQLYPKVLDAGPSMSSCAWLPSEAFSSGAPYVHGPGELRCVVCPANHRLLGYQAVREPEAPDVPSASIVTKLESRCQPPDGGVAVFMTSSGRCDLEGSKRDVPPATIRFTRPVVLDVASPYRLSYAGDLGHVWVGRDNGLRARALFADQTPVGLVSVPGLGTSFSTPSRALQRIGTLHTDPVVEPASFQESPGGLTPAFSVLSDIDYEAVVAGQPSWVLRHASLSGRSSMVVVQLLPDERYFHWIARFPDAVAFSPPYNASYSVNRAGDHLLLVTSGDALLSARVNEQEVKAADAGFPLDIGIYLESPELQTRLVPVPRTNITSMIVLPPAAQADGKTDYAEGYLLQAGRLFRFTAPNQYQFFSEELAGVVGDVLEVFNDGRRGRAGMRDGVVWTLPSRVRVSAALPASALPVVDYAQVCAHTFALSAGGLFRLVADGSSPVGRWEPVSIPATLLPARAQDFAGGRLLTEGSTLWLFMGNGWAFRLSDLSCGG